MSVRCGNPTHRPETVHHDTVAQVRLCFERARREEDDAAEAEAEARAERVAEMATERHFEERGADEAYAQERWEAERGVIPFDVACAEAMAAAQPGPALPPLTDELLATIPVSRGRGRYALRGEDGEVTLYWVDRRTEGGPVFVKVAHARANLKGAERARVFRAILDDTLGASKLYAEKTGECGVCGTELTVQESIDAKIGPKCAKKF